MYVFKHMLSVFKQHYTYFHTFFHPHIFPKNTNNVTRTTLSNDSFSQQHLLKTFLQKGKLSYLKTDWETTHFGHYVELEWKLKVFSNLVFEFHYIKVRFLLFILEFNVICYFSWMK